MGANTKKPANVFDDAFEPFLRIKVNVFYYMIGMNGLGRTEPEQPPSARTAAEKLSKKKIRVNQQISLSWWIASAKMLVVLALFCSDTFTTILHQAETFSQRNGSC